MNGGRRRWWLGLLLAAVVAAGFAGWRLTRGMNGLGVDCVVLVTLDTVRADRLGCYGSAAGLTPRLDALAAGGLRFRRCLATAPMTLPSHASILTGTDPIAHGARINGSFALDAANVSIAEVLRERGFATGAFVSAFVLDRQYGLDQGFDEYDDVFVAADGSSDPSTDERRGERTVDAALEFVRRTGSAPAFLWVHLFDAHAKYEPPKAFDSRGAAGYDAEVAYVDHCVGRLLDGLADLGRLEHALVTVTADHGESLGDHKESTHTVFVYDSTLSVPWLVWAGGDRLPRGRVIEPAASTTSIAPTLLELLQFERPREMYAPSRAAELRTDGGRRPPQPLYFESLAGPFWYDFAPLTGIEVGGWKLIVAPRAELYHVAEDPAEQINRFESERTRATELKLALDHYVREHETRRSKIVDPDPAATQRLFQLGYVALHASGTGSQKDPKDEIEALELLQSALLRAEREPTAAIRELREFVQLRPQIAEGWEQLGKLLQQEGDLEGARDAFRSALPLRSNDPGLYFQLATVQAPLGDVKGAIRNLEGAIERDPKHVQAMVFLGSVHLAQDRPGGARELFDRALAIQPRFAPALRGLAQCQARQNNLRGAEETLKRALEIERRNPDLLEDLAAIQEQLGRPEEAELARKRASELRDRELRDRSEQPK